MTTARVAALVIIAFFVVVLFVRWFMKSDNRAELAADILEYAAKALWFLIMASILLSLACAIFTGYWPWDPRSEFF